jgi:hypothetical protein
MWELIIFSYLIIGATLNWLAIRGQKLTKDSSLSEGTLFFLSFIWPITFLIGIRRFYKNRNI